MLCEKPFQPKGGMVYYACNKCKPCLINRARTWAGRIQLEAECHNESCFVTLTYADASDGTVPRSLCKKDVRDWLKRLRKAIAPSRIRYYLVGEYGPSTLRPHYHAILFGLGVDLAAGYDGSMLTGTQGVVRRTWSLGGSVVGAYTPKCGAYVAGYVTEKINAKRICLDGVDPEFQTMSLRPGIGASALPSIAAVLGSDFGLDAIANCGDVPVSLRMGRSSLPLGRYLRGKLRKEVGLSEDIVKQSNYKRQVAEVLKLRESVQAEAEVVSGSFHKIMLDRLKQKCLNRVARYSVFKPAKQI